MRDGRASTTRKQGTKTKAASSKVRVATLL